MEKSSKISVLIVFILFVAILVFLLFSKPTINIFYNDYLTNNVQIELNGKLNNLKVKSDYLFKDISNNIQVVKNDVDYSKVGNYEIKYKLKFLIYTVSKSLYVRVIESEPPIITLNGNNESKSCSVDTYVEEGYSAFDNYDGDITSKVDVQKNGDKIEYKVMDSSGNTTVVTRTIVSTDNIVPEITINGEEKVYIEKGKKYEELGFIVSDNCDLSIENTSIEGTVDNNKVGSYEIVYKATDSSGNEGKKSRFVYVYDPQNAQNNNDNEKGVIYLTFDDGPSIYTTKILNTLKKYDIKATFFVTNNGNDKTIKREFEEGHTIALHTASHNYEKVYSSVDGYFKDLNKISNRVERITNTKSYIIRFPGGSSNTISKSCKKGIMSTLTKEVLNRGYHYFDWTASVEDAGKCAYKNTDKQKQKCVYNKFVKALSKNKMNVILMHDIKPYTADKLDDMIKYALSQGYTFDKITMETTQVHHKVNN